MYMKIRKLQWLILIFLFINHETLAFKKFRHVTFPLRAFLNSFVNLFVSSNLGPVTRKNS